MQIFHILSACHIKYYKTLKVNVSAVSTEICAHCYISVTMMDVISDPSGNDCRFISCTANFFVEIKLCVLCNEFKINILKYIKVNTIN